MKKILALTFAACIGLASVISAQAAPMAPLSQAPETTVIKVAGGCGAGKHRGPHGGCLLNFAHPAMHACPRGFHLGPHGRCRGN